MPNGCADERLRLFQDFYPGLFEELRSKVRPFTCNCVSKRPRCEQVFRCSHEEYIQSIAVRENGAEIEEMQERFSEGRSGSFLYFSHDERFIVKTLRFVCRRFDPL
jgi:hypothetical protein